MAGRALRLRRPRRAIPRTVGFFWVSNGRLTPLLLRKEADDISLQPGVTKERSSRTLLCDRLGNRAARVRFRPLVDLMEGRTLLSILVSNAGDSGPGSLRAAIEQANATPDTIMFAPSVTGTITLETALPDLSSDITIQGPGASVLAVANGITSGIPVRNFNVTATAQVAISGLEIRGAPANYGAGGGGGIANAGSLTVSHCLFSGNYEGSTADRGGGIGNSGTLTVNDCIFRGNTGYGYAAGGGISNAGTATITGCTFTDNSGNGGGIGNSGSMTVTNSTVNGNSGSMGGGGIDNEAPGVLMITNCTISENSADSMGSGGGIYNVGDLTVTGCTLNENSAGAGGGIWNTGSGVLTIVNSALSGNMSTDRGGALGNFFKTTVTNCTLSGNSAQQGVQFTTVVSSSPLSTPPLAATRPGPRGEALTATRAR